ncbi:helix-turn-helix domain-containing protein [Streptomyces sp. A-14]|uniref:helix-turn-helix domain-containing protein n=1 Tax=Streptomyces sp. A-14 TaxID=3127467 RepID=UPI003EBFC0F3
MAHPGRGEPYSVRSLAEASGVGQGVVEKLLTGRQRTADVDDAIAIAEALGVAINPLFAPPSSPNPKRTSLKSNRSLKE